MSFKNWFLSILIAIIVCLSGCAGGPPRPKDIPDNIAPIPLGLLLLQELSGTVFGQVIESPIGVAVDKRGIIFLVDSGNNRVIRLDNDIVPQRDIGGHGRASGLFDMPQYLTIDQDENLWVSDHGNRRVVRLSNRLEVLYEIDLRDEDDPLAIGHPSGIAVTDYGEAWVADPDNHQIVVLDNIGRFNKYIGDFGYNGGQLRNPAKVISDEDGRFYVCDAGNGRVVVYDEYGNYERVIEDEGLIQPLGAALDAWNRLWVIDGVTGQLHCYDSEGFKLTTLGPVIPGANDVLMNPSDLVFDQSGRLLISDTGNDRLLVCHVVFDENPTSK